VTALAQLAPEDAAKVLALAAANIRIRQAEPERRPLLPHQKTPEGPWDIWLLLGGRGSGKTEAGSRATNAHAEGPPCIEGPVPHRMAIIAPSHDDAVDTCVRGETGLLQVNRAVRFAPGALLRADLTWPNGAEAELFGTFAPEDVERFRGPQHCFVWWDEFAACRKLDESWDMVQFGLRLGTDPKMILTTTPKRRPKLREVIDMAGTVTVRARTDDNPGLPESRRVSLYERYGGTTIGRQELDAEIIDDVAGALWRRDIIRMRPAPTKLVEGKPVIDYARIVVAIDPAVTAGEDSDETGIVVNGLGHDGMGYTISDLSRRALPAEWARTAVDAYHAHGADLIVGEANNGGEMVREVVRAVDPRVPVKLVHASRGKTTRAQPIATVYEQGRWFHVGPMPELEDQMCSYTGAPNEASPDRMDAHVWGASELLGLSGSGTWGGGQAWGT
jgi:predicted phage terminase large subunit-like protein